MSPRRLPLLLTMLLMSTLAAAQPRADDATEVQHLMRDGKLPAALELAQKAATAQPRDAKLRFLQGVILLDLKRDADAMAVFQQMTEDFPELPDPYNNIALLQARAGKLDAARASLEIALRNDPGHLLARANLGQIYLRLAVQAWETAASAMPGDAALQRRLKAARELAAMAK